MLLSWSETPFGSPRQSLDDTTGSPGRVSAQLLSLIAGSRDDPPLVLAVPGWGGGGRPIFFVARPATVPAGPGRVLGLSGRGRRGGFRAAPPPIEIELQNLIRRMARENPRGGRRRIQAELRLLG